MHREFHLPRFYPIIDTAVLAKSSIAPLPLGKELVDAGAKILQYRNKSAWTQVEFDESRALSQLCRENDVVFVLNDRADFANLLEAGLHIGQDDLPPAAAREVVPNAILGFSTHNGLQLRQASEVAADYLSLGPIFATTSKEKPDPVVGLDGLKALRVFAEKPVVAIGGITLENAAETLASGADSVAVISGLLPPDGSLETLKERLARWLEITRKI